MALGMSHELRGDRVAAYRAYAKVAESGHVFPQMQGLIAGVDDLGSD